MKCLFWGMTEVYQQYKNVIDFEIAKGNIEPLAIISKEKFCQKLDGLSVINKEDIMNYQFDYLVVFAKAYEQIKVEALNMGIDENKIIDGNIFGIPCFDFKRYVSLIENPVTIISEDCFGGMIYKYLGLKMSSPFINFLIGGYDYLDLLKDFENNIKSEIVSVREEDFKNNIFPKARFASSNSIINLIHYSSFDEFCTTFARRQQRINYDNLLFKMTIENDEQAELFDALPLKNKVGFYYKQTDYESIVTLPYWYNRKYIKDFVMTYRFDNFVRMTKYLSSEIDVLKMLVDKKDFVRAK